MMKQNLHTHTTFCDGKNSPEEMILAALEQGMDSLGFSGHSPLGEECWVMGEEVVPRYRQEVLRLQEAYAGRLDIFLGLEQDILSPAPEGAWDYLIGSVHALEREGELLSVDESTETFCRGVEKWFGGDPLAFAEAYYRQVGTVAEQTGCRIVGHFDLVCKFNEGNRLFDTGHSRVPRRRPGGSGAAEGEGRDPGDQHRGHVPGVPHRPLSGGVDPERGPGRWGCPSA